MSVWRRGRRVVFGAPPSRQRMTVQRECRLLLHAPDDSSSVSHHSMPECNQLGGKLVFSKLSLPYGSLPFTALPSSRLPSRRTARGIIIKNQPRARPLNRCNTAFRYTHTHHTHVRGHTPRVGVARARCRPAAAHGTATGLTPDTYLRERDRGPEAVSHLHTPGSGGTQYCDMREISRAQLRETLKVYTLVSCPVLRREYTLHSPAEANTVE